MEKENNYEGIKSIYHYIPHYDIETLIDFDRVSKNPCSEIELPKQKENKHKYILIRR